MGDSLHQRRQQKLPVCAGKLLLHQRRRRRTGSRDVVERESVGDRLHQRPSFRVVLRAAAEHQAQAPAQVVQVRRGRDRLPPRQRAAVRVEARQKPGSLHEPVRSGGVLRGKHDHGDAVGVEEPAGAGLHAHHGQGLVVRGFEGPGDSHPDRADLRHDRLPVRHPRHDRRQLSRSRGKTRQRTLRQVAAADRLPARHAVLDSAVAVRRRGQPAGEEVRRPPREGGLPGSGARLAEVRVGRNGPARVTALVRRRFLPTRGLAVLRNRRPVRRRGQVHGGARFGAGTDRQGHLFPGQRGSGLEGQDEGRL